MKLMTKAIEKALPKLKISEHVKMEVKTIVCKFFDPCSHWTWYVAEGERDEDGDLIFFGLVIGFEKEWGYFSLAELEGVRNRMGLPLERDLHFTPCKVSELRGVV